MKRRKKILIVIMIIVLVIILSPYITSYSQSVSGKLIDAETRKPVVGAIIFVEWTQTHGIGDTSTQVYKVIEIESNEDGKFFAAGPKTPFVNPPNIVIYKKGYIGWNNEFSFPGHKRRIGSYPVGGNRIELEKFIPKYPFEPVNVNEKIAPYKRRHINWDGNSSFDPEYTHYAHFHFIDSFIWLSGIKIKHALRWEEQKAQEDIDTLVKADIHCRVVDAETHRPVDGATIKVSGMGQGYTAGKNWESISDKDGKIRIVTDAPLLSRPPSITACKSGYRVWKPDTDWDAWRNLKAGFVFELTRCRENEMQHEFCCK